MSKKVKVIFTILLALLVVGGLSKIFLSKHSSEYAYNIGDTVKIKDQSLVVNSVKTSIVVSVPNPYSVPFFFSLHFCCSLYK